MAASWHTSKSLALVLLIVLVGQVSFAWSIKHIRPDLGYVPTPPTAEFLEGVALGDHQFLFRGLALMIQNSGDTFGRFSALKLYNYDDLSRWLTLEDGLDSASNYMPSMAAYYFSQTQNTADIRYLVDYLYEHSIKDVKAKWWWLMQAIYLANHKLEDPELTLKIAKPLGNKDLPVMAQQMLAIVYEQRGELDQAFDIITAIQENSDEISEKDLRYMYYFAEERLKRLEEYEKKVRDLGKPILPAPHPATPTNNEGTDS